MGQLFAKVQEFLSKCSQRQSQVNINIFGDKKCPRNDSCNRYNNAS